MAIQLLDLPFQHRSREKGDQNPQINPAFERDEHPMLCHHQPWKPGMLERIDLEQGQHTSQPNQNDKTTKQHMPRNRPIFCDRGNQKIDCGQQQCDADRQQRLDNVSHGHSCGRREFRHAARPMFERYNSSAKPTTLQASGEISSSLL